MDQTEKQSDERIPGTIPNGKLLFLEVPFNVIYFRAIKRDNHTILIAGFNEDRKLVSGQLDLDEPDEGPYVLGLDKNTTADFIHEMTVGLKDPGYPTSNYPGDLKVVMHVLATLARKLGYSQLDNDLSFLADKFSVEFRKCLEES